MTATTAPNKGRILVVGLERPLFQKIDPVLNRSKFVVDRVPRGESGKLLASHAAFDLIVVRHPLPDMSLGSLLNSVHEPGSPCGAAPILVLTDESRLSEVRGLMPGGTNQVVSINEPWKLLQEVASQLLGVAPRIATRVMIRVEVQLEGEAKSQVMCQSENLSENGMLLRSDRLFPIGTRVSFESMLPGERAPIHGQAEVVRHTVPDVENVQGMGLKVLGFKGDGQKRLRGFLSRKTSA